MWVTYEDILEIFVEASKLGQRRLWLELPIRPSIGGASKLKRELPSPVGVTQSICSDCGAQVEVRIGARRPIHVGNRGSSYCRKTSHAA